jgi:hypothetical protein
VARTPSHFATKILYVISPMRTVCPAHFILISTHRLCSSIHEFPHCAVLCICLLISVSPERVYPVLPSSATCLLRLIAFSVYFIKYYLKRSFKSTTNVLSKSCKLKDSVRSGTDVCQILELQRRKRRSRQACCEILDVMLFRIREIYK